MSFGNEKCTVVETLICPHCKETLIINKRQFANHVRWCKANPKYEEIRNSTINKIKKNCEIKHDELFHNRDIECPICNKIFTINISDSDFNRGKYRKTCSDECAKKLTAQNTDKEEKNKKVSESVKEFVRKNNPEGIISERETICPNCGIVFTPKKRNQKFCSNKCNIEFHSKEALRDQDFMKRYKSQCVFDFSLNEFPEEFDFDLIENFGWYSASNHGNNVDGVSRDHMLSCREGGKLLIDPYLISHPANCKLILQRDNASKRDKSTITLEELQKRINDWNLKYGEYPNKINYNIIPEIIRNN